ncbi:MAG TPA: hypothetical protein VFU51_10735 [Gaiellaceae bacterium]|nr:hypothetical protein [Gaiellaceae bacterium]
MRTIHPSNHSPGSEPALSFDQLRSSLVDLQPTLLSTDGLAVVFGHELWLWSWVTELLVGVPSPGSPRRYIEGDDLHGGPGTLLRLSIWTALADCRPPLSLDKHARKEETSKKLEEEPNAQQLVGSRTSILTYLSFPLLEALTKLRCCDHVSLDGRALQRFTVDDETYGPGKRVSGLKHLLLLLSEHVASPTEKEALESIRSSIQVARGIDGFKQISAWRNSQAHGSESLQAIGYTVYNLALLVGLHGIQDRFDDIREDARAFIAELLEIEAHHNSPRFTPLHYYPPHWRKSLPGITHISTL